MLHINFWLRIVEGDVLPFERQKHLSKAIEPRIAFFVLFDYIHLVVVLPIISTFVGKFTKNP